jgi:hypothetical protein
MQKETRTIRNVGTVKEKSPTKKPNVYLRAQSLSAVEKPRFHDVCVIVLPRLDEVCGVGCSASSILKSLLPFSVRRIRTWGNDKSSSRAIPFCAVPLERKG